MPLYEVPEVVRSAPHRHGRTLAKTGIFWRFLRHGWLYLNHLDTIGTLERRVRFYVEAHNATPHSSFRGPTPDELCHGKADRVVLDLAEAKKKAREAR